MKKTLIAALFALTIIGTGCLTSGATETVDVVKIPETAVTRSFEVQDMTCVSCAFGVEAALKELEGVYDATVDYKTTTGSVTYDEELVTDEQIIEAADPYSLIFQP